MDKTKVSIIKAIAMGKVKPALDREYLTIAIKALQWERASTQDQKIISLYRSFEDDVKRFMDGMQSAIIDRYTVYAILYYHFALRFPLLQAINKGKKDAYHHYVERLISIIKGNDDRKIEQAQKAINECNQRIQNLRYEMEGIKGNDTTAIKLENHQGNNRLLQFMEKIEDHEDNIAVYQMYIVLMKERKKHKQDFISTLNQEERRILSDCINDRSYQDEDVEKVIKANINYWDNGLYPDKVW